jgi:hypothetical protein
VADRGITFDRVLVTGRTIKIGRLDFQVPMEIYKVVAMKLQLIVKETIS